MTDQLGADIEAADDFRAHLGRNLVSLAHKWRRALSRKIATLGVSDAQWSLLDSLHRTGDGVHQQVLATRLGLDRSAIVRVLNDMEQSGLIFRGAASHDARQKLVYLTAEGRELAAQIYDVIRSVEVPLMENIPFPKLEQFIEVVQVLTEKVDALDAAHSHHGVEDI